MQERQTRLARKLRRDQTDAERRLWSCLRDRRLNGLKFRRQVPIDIYVADFLCKEAMLVVELDGSQHADQTLDHDLRRTAALEGWGYRVLRFWNNDLTANLEGVLTSILANCEERTLTPTLSREREREFGRQRIQRLSETRYQQKGPAIARRAFRILEADRNLPITRRRLRPFP